MISKLGLPFFSLFALASLLGAPAFGAEKIKIVTTIPELAWMAQEIGGDLVETKALLRGTENPHFVDAVPTFISAVADAKIVCLVGLDLEVGYLPPILSKSGNAGVQTSGPGYCETGRSVTVIDKPAGAVDRSMGDVHPSGNPHYWLSPQRLAEASVELVKALGRIDPAHAVAYEQKRITFAAQMDELAKEINAQLEPFRQRAGPKPILIEYHKEFAYFLAGYGIKSMGSIEEKPGVPPSAGRLAEISAAAKAAGIKVALAADYNPSKTLERFHELSGVTLVTVPTMMQARGTYKSYPELQRHIASRLLAALGPLTPGKP